MPQTWLSMPELYPYWFINRFAHHPEGRRHPFRDREENFLTLQHQRNLLLLRHSFGLPRILAANKSPNVGVFPRFLVSDFAEILAIQSVSAVSRSVRCAIAQIHIRAHEANRKNFCSRVAPLRVNRMSLTGETNSERS